MNKRGKCLKEENVMFRKERNDSPNIVVVNPKPSCNILSLQKPGGDAIQV